MELTREQIIESLKYCTGIKKISACADCPACVGCNDCINILIENSLKLIEELAEDNKRLRAEVSVRKKLLEKAEEDLRYFR